MISWERNATKLYINVSLTHRNKAELFATALRYKREYIYIYIYHFKFMLSPQRENIFIKKCKQSFSVRILILWTWNIRNSVSLSSFKSKLI